jgi:hypothetical protein
VLTASSLFTIFTTFSASQQFFLSNQLTPSCLFAQSETFIPSESFTVSTIILDKEFLPNAAEQTATRLITNQAIGIGVGGFIVLMTLLLFFFLFKKKKKTTEQCTIENTLSTNSIDTIDTIDSIDSDEFYISEYGISDDGFTGVCYDKEDSQDVMFHSFYISDVRNASEYNPDDFNDDSFSLIEA